MKQIAVSGIVGWDVTAAEVREQLLDAAGDEIEVVFTTPGGLVSEGLDLFNQFRSYPGKKTARLAGFAMSMGSYIPLAFDRIVAEDNAVFMIHNVHGGVVGDHNEILRYGETTKAMSNLLSRVYAQRTGLDISQIQGLMDAETYYFGEDIVAAGFADEIVQSSEDNDKASAMALANIAFQSCNKKLAEEVSAVKDDLTRIAVMAGDLIHIENRAAAAARKEAGMMTEKELREQHPELVVAIEEQARQGMIAQVDAETAQIEAVATEHQRIMALVVASVGEESAGRIQAVAAKGLTAEDMEALGIDLTPQTEGNNTGQQMLTAITAAAANGVQTGIGTTTGATTGIDTAGIYASRREQIKAGH